VRFEIFTEVKIQVEVFWVVTPCGAAVGCHDEDGGSWALRSYRIPG